MQETGVDRIMPEIVTILFYCDAPFEPNMVDPLRVGECQRCRDAQELLYNFLRDHHISWYEYNVTKDEMLNEEERLINMGAKEYE